MTMSQPSAPLQPAPAPITHDVTTRKFAQALVMGVPPEEFGIKRGARSIRDCNYCLGQVGKRKRRWWFAEGRRISTAA